MNCPKNLYPDKRAALSARNQRTRGHVHWRGSKRPYLRAYYCHRCGGWHLTKNQHE